MPARCGASACAPMRGKRDPCSRNEYTSDDLALERESLARQHLQPGTGATEKTLDKPASLR
jgi:hypothetical protein